MNYITSSPIEYASGQQQESSEFHKCMLFVINLKDGDAVNNCRVSGKFSIYH